MLSNIVNKIKSKIKDVYPNFNVYVKAAQAVESPAFIIKITEYSKINELINRGKISAQFKLTCKLADSNELSLYEIALNLSDILHEIRLDNYCFYPREHKAVFNTDLEYTFIIDIPCVRTVINDNIKINKLKSKVLLS